jgi:hypothetical protein
MSPKPSASLDLTRPQANQTITALGKMPTAK